MGTRCLLRQSSHRCKKSQGREGLEQGRTRESVKGLVQRVNLGRHFPGSFGGVERVAFPSDFGKVHLGDKAGSFSVRRRCLHFGTAACVGAPGLRIEK